MRAARCRDGRQAPCLYFALIAALALSTPAVAQNDPPPDLNDNGLSADITAALKGELAESAPPEQIIHVGADDRVTMHVSGLNLTDALRMLAEPKKRNIVLADGVSGSVSANLYNATFEEALKAILVSNGLGYRVQGQFIFVHPLDQLQAMVDAERKIQTRVFRLTYVNAKSARELIEPLLSKTGTITITPAAQTGLGGGDGGDLTTEGDSYAATDTLVIRDYADKLDEITELIRRLDSMPRQVLVEATILRATLNEDNALGIDFTTVGGVDFQQLSSTSPGVQSISTGALPQTLLNETNLTVRTDFNAGVPDGGFTFGIIKDQISLFIRALEQITDTEVLANPKVLALNKQVGQVIVGRRDGYLTTTFTETQAIQTVEFLETGTLLTFRPFIGDDGYVRMEIHPKDSTGGLTGANLPFEQTTEVTTNVLVQDGHTILIGGLFREVSTASRGQVPGLGNVPGVGALFRNTRDTTVREEVIILLTVHVVKSDRYDRASEELKEDVERFRVGMRGGMQWFGRERLSQAHYRSAIEHAANGDIGRALWDVDLAMHNFGRHVQAAKLKEALTRERAWESEASQIRTFVRERILDSQGIVEPPFDRPAPPYSLPDELQGPFGTESEAAEQTPIEAVPLDYDASDDAEELP